MKNLLFPLLGSLLIAGCTTTPVMTPAQLTSTVSQGLQLGLSVYPPAAPGVAVARDVICAEVGKTNVNPAAIVADLSQAGITNSQAKIIINGAVFAYNTVFMLLNTNSLANAEPYLQALCAGFTEALPPNVMVPAKSAHLE